MNSRRRFLQTIVAGSAAVTVSKLWPLEIGSVAYADTQLGENAVRFSDEIEPTVRLLEETPRDELLEEIAARIKRGSLTYREVVAALMLAGIRNVQPRPSVGFKFHTVLVVNSAHLASMNSPAEDRWLPIFWALDYFKVAQADDHRRGDWTMPAVDDAKLPPFHHARQEFQQAMDAWAMFLARLKDDGKLPEKSVEQMTGAESTASTPAEVSSILTNINADADQAASQVLGLLDRDPAAAAALFRAARRMIFFKGSGTHDYKYSSAVLEDFYYISPAFRNRYLASSIYKFRGSGERDTQLLPRIRAALA